MEAHMTQIPTVTLNNNIKMPQLGLGVWQTKDGRQVIDAVHAAIDTGYRLIDTAAMYANEDGIGEAIRTASVPREELFVTTKLWNSDQGHSNALKAFDASLRRLGLDYIDLYLIHWPAPALDKYVETWRALEEIYASGRAKAIGVCNFNQEHLEKLLNATAVVPAVNQIELHPRLQQQGLRDYCKAKGIQVESWSPIGGTGGDLLNDPILQTIADKHHRSTAQIVIRWHIQLGLVVIPKSTHAERIAQNAEVFDFELDSDDMANISTLNTNTRRGPDPATMHSGIPTGLVQLASKLGIPKLRK
jgi:2,5-diketo-D-gluconate reductase A